MGTNKAAGLEDRMKDNYEHRYRFKLTRRTPVIMRLDGKAFHTVTKNCMKPFDSWLNKCMRKTAHAVMEEIQGAKCFYTQSDEISLLITDFDKFTTDAWFDYNIQKMCSIAAGLASAIFTINFYDPEEDEGEYALFDCRVFNIPKEEVANYFIQRQQDWMRNSVQMMAQANFSHKELYKKSVKMMKEMLLQIDKDWDKIHTMWKHGSFCTRDRSWTSCDHFEFTKNREVFNELMEAQE